MEALISNSKIVNFPCLCKASKACRFSPNNQILPDRYPQAPSENSATVRFLLKLPYYNCIDNRLVYVSAKFCGFHYRNKLSIQISQSVSQPTNFSPVKIDYWRWEEPETDRPVAVLLECTNWNNSAAHKLAIRGQFTRVSLAGSGLFLHGSFLATAPYWFSAESRPRMRPQFQFQ